MKNTTLFFSFCLFLNFVTAQNSSKQLPISVGYLGQLLVQPGVKVGTQFSIKQWGAANQNEQTSDTKQRSLFVSPQVGCYFRPGNNTNFMTNVDFGYRISKIKRDRPAYSAFSVGLGYLVTSQVNSISINLGDGKTKDKERELQHYFVPTLNYEFGRAINKKIGWYSKYGIGTKLTASKTATMVILVEFGLSFFLH